MSWLKKPQITGRHKIVLGPTEINYVVRQNRRAKRLSLTIYPDSRLAITLPTGWFNLAKIENLLRAKRSFILKKLQELSQVEQRPLLVKNTRANYLKYKEAARSLVADKLRYYNQVYNLPYQQVAIRNQRTRWGSCSQRRNLNFNYRLVFLPTELVDYLVVHELCHLAELNHSPRFWQLVEQTLPDYRARRRALKKYRLY